MYRPIIVCIVAQPNKILGGRPTCSAHATHGVDRERCKPPPSGVRGRAPTAVAFCCRPLCMLAKRIWLQHFWYFAQQCNEWQNESQSRLRSNLVSAGNLRHTNIIVVQTGNLIFVGSKIAAPLNFAALFGRTPRTCLRPALYTRMRRDVYVEISLRCTRY